MHLPSPCHLGETRTGLAFTEKVISKTLFLHRDDRVGLSWPGRLFCSQQSTLFLRPKAWSQGMSVTSLGMRHEQTLLKNYS